MSDFISRKDALKIIDNYIDGSFEWGAMMLKIKRLPTADVVEVVRCKDCENWDMHWISSTFTENVHRCVVLDNVFDGEFYCACAHRRRSV